jgi:hypothetical protein
MTVELIHARDRIRQIDSYREVQEIFSQPSETPLFIAFVNPFNPKCATLEQVQDDLARVYPDLDLRFDANYVVHRDGIIFDGINYARWENVTGGCAYVVYSRNKHEAQSRWSPTESRKHLMSFIRAASQLAVIRGDEAWVDSVVKPAVELFGEHWQDEVFPRGNQ